MRSAPPLEEPDSDSLPIPDSLPKPPNDGMLGGSAGRATGRPPPTKELDGLGAGAGAGAAARAAGLGAAFGAAALTGAAFRLAGALRLAVARFAVVFFVPDRFAVLFFAVLRLAVDFFLVEDFFFAGIFPPSDARRRVRAWFRRMRTRCCYLRFIASDLRKDKHFPMCCISSR